MKKLETKSLVLLKHHLKALKLPTIQPSARRLPAAVPRTTSITWASFCSSASWS